MAYELKESLGTPAGVGVVVGYNAAARWSATQWVANQSYTLTQISVSLRRIGTPDTMTITAHVWSEGAGVPDSATVQSSPVTLSGANVANSYTDYVFPFANGVTITANTTYWLGVSTNSVNTTNYCAWQYGGYLLAHQLDQSINGVTWANTLDRRGIAATYANGAGTTTQEGYRFRYDDGDDANASWVAAQDTPITTTTDSRKRLRILLDTTGDADPAEYQLEYKEANDANYTAVT